MDTALSEWVQIQATVSDDGTVNFSVDHFALFAFFEVRTVSRDLASPWTAITLTGPSGTTTADFVASLRTDVTSAWR